MLEYRSAHTLLAISIMYIHPVIVDFEWCVRLQHVKAISTYESVSDFVKNIIFFLIRLTLLYRGAFEKAGSRNL